MTTPIRIAMLGIAPVHYHAPVYRRLAADPRLDFTAIFASSAGVRPGRLGYGAPVAWDEDVLSGYRSVFLRRARTNEHDGSFLGLRDLDVVRELVGGRYEVLWSHGYYSATHVLAALTQRALGRPVLLREEQTLLRRRPLAKRLAKRALFAAAYRGATGLAVGSENRRWLVAQGVRPQRIFPTPYSVDNERLETEAVRLAPLRDELRRAFGLRGDAPVVLSVGRLIEEKQPGLVLDAFARVRRERACSLLVVGSGPLEHGLRERVARERISDVVFAGFVNRSRIAEAYAAADVFALPSARETWGIAVNEAMVFGLPVVVSDAVGCATDLVDDGRTGYVVDATSPALLAARLRELVADAELRRRLGAAGRARIAAWNADASAAGVLAAVEHAVGPKRWAAAGAGRAALVEAWS